MMRNDDRYSMSRRAVVRGLGTVPVLALFGRATRALAECFETPEETEGPFWVDERLNRSDITVDPSSGAVMPGVPLSLAITVLRADADCAPAAGVQVDIWHCSAGGLYSDESSNGTAGQAFLRGYQTTDANGIVQFQTIYPGWYSGRTIHIHVRVRAFDGTTTTANFTTQVYFDDAVSDAVIEGNAAYDHGTRDTFNTNDNLYMADTLVTLGDDGSGGYVGVVDVALTGLPAGSETGTCGDADGSGAVAVTDGVQALREAAGLDSACAGTVCDVDGDGAVTVSDGVRILRAAAGLSADLACP